MNWFLWIVGGGVLVALVGIFGGYNWWKRAKLKAAEISEDASVDAGEILDKWVTNPRQAAHDLYKKSQAVLPHLFAPQIAPYMLTILIITIGFIALDYFGLVWVFGGFFGFFLFCAIVSIHIGAAIFQIWNDNGEGDWHDKKRSGLSVSVSVLSAVAMTCLALFISPMLSGAADSGEKVKATVSTSLFADYDAKAIEVKELRDTKSRLNNRIRSLEWDEELQRKGGKDRNGRLVRAGMGKKYDKIIEEIKRKRKELPTAKTDVVKAETELNTLKLKMEKRGASGRMSTKSFHVPEWVFLVSILGLYGLREILVLMVADMVGERKNLATIRVDVDAREKLSDDDYQKVMKSAPRGVASALKILSDKKPLDIPEPTVMKSKKDELNNPLHKEILDLFSNGLKEVSGENLPFNKLYEAFENAQSLKGVEKYASQQEFALALNTISKNRENIKIAKNQIIGWSLK